MSRDIRTLVSSELHEPKYISDSTSADAGKVITPLSGGDSELRNLTPSEVGVNFYYLEWTVDENSTAISLPQATDTNLYTPAEFTKINSVNLPGGVVDNSNGMTFDSTNYDIEVPVDGTYRINFWANVLSDTNNTKVGFKATVDGTAIGSTVKHDIAATGRVINISASALISLTQGQNVGIAIASDKAANVTILDLKPALILVREV